MIDTVMFYISQILIFAISLPICVILIGSVLPGVFLRPVYRVGADIDVGVEKYRIPGGRAVLYRPSGNNRRYVKKYLLYCVGEEKSIVCKFSQRFSSIRYTLTAFDADDRVVGLIDVRETLDGDTVSETPGLPDDTAYVSLRVREVDGETVGEAASVGYRADHAAIFFALTVVCTAIEAIVIKLALSPLFGISDFLSGIALPLIASIALGAVYALITVKKRLSSDAKLIFSKLTK